MTQDDARALLAALDMDDWSAVREAVEQAGDVLRTQQVDDALRAGVASRLLHLSSHPKWEVRKAVAHGPGQCVGAEVGQGQAAVGNLPGIAHQQARQQPQQRGFA